MFSQNSPHLVVNELNLTKPASNKLGLQKEFLIYLDQENIIKNLQLTTISYEKSVNGCLSKLHFNPPFRFTLILDLIKLQEISEKLYYLFMREPNAGIDLSKNVIFICLRSMITNIKLRKSDLQIVPRVINLPVTREIEDLLKYPSYGLESFQGVLLNKTTVAKYVRSSVYRCETSFCSGKNGRRYPQNFKKICPECLSLMKEDISFTDTGEQVICQFVSLKALQTTGTFHVLNVSVKDEFCSNTNLDIGQEYKVTGRLVESFNVEAMDIHIKQLTPEFGLSLCTLPKAIADLYHQVSQIRPNCPWSFVCALSSPLGSRLIPTSSYLNLKIGLMLSLCTQKNDEPPAPLVAIGSDSLNAQYLFHMAGKLARRYIRYSTAQSYMGGAVKPGIQSDVIWLEAGQFILAATGICNLGDWSRFRRDQANCICQTIESGQIILNKKDVGKVIDFVRLKCAVWTYWCHITTSSNDQLQLKTLINVFGIPFLAEEKNENEMRKICRKNLEKAMNNNQNETSTETVPAEDMKEFIEIISFRELILSDEASHLIRSYFVAKRQKRPQCLPLGAIKTITSLAEAHARLALRNEVLYEDVVAIIYLYEESISTFFGESMTSFQKLNWNQEEPIYVFMGKQLQNFKVWLENYLSM